MEYTTNYYITKLTDKLAEKTCGVSPDILSIFNMIFSLYIVYVLYHGKGIILFITLNVIRVIIDIYNDSLYSICKDKHSYNRLDYVNDNLYILLLLVVIYLKTNNVSIKIFSILLINLTIACILLSIINNRNKNIFSENMLSDMIKNNSIILYPLISYLFYSILY